MRMLNTLKELELESIARGIPIIGHDKGIWLQQKVKDLNPKTILELGTANGYSGCILGANDALLTTVELDEKIALEAKENFEKFSIAAEVIVDDAVAVLKEFVVDKAKWDSFDLIFIDCAKKVYAQVLDNCLKLVRIGGLIIADNISFEGCQDFKKMVFDHKQLKTELVNIGDGLSCSERIS